MMFVCFCRKCGYRRDINVIAVNVCDECGHRPLHTVSWKAGEEKAAELLVAGLIAGEARPTMGFGP